MSLSEKRKKGTASQMIASEEHDSKAKIPIQQKSPFSTVPMDHPVKVRGCDISTEPGLIQLERPAPPVPSYVSMKSDWSMDSPVQFTEGDICTEQCLIQLERPASLVPSYVSMKSDWSMDRPVQFKQFDISTKQSMDHGGERMLKSGLRKYVCDLTLDPNTVNRLLLLSEENRKVTRRGKEQQYLDHPERFEFRPQVLCREGLSGRCYWEVEWSGGGAYIGVTYKGINRRGKGLDCWLGFNNKSWNLACYDGGYSACHNNNTTNVHVTSSGSHRVGVYLDWPAGTLSFYRVSSDTLTHLYTFNTTFTEPLYPGFYVYSNSSVSLCQMVPVSNTT